MALIQFKIAISQGNYYTVPMTWQLTYSNDFSHRYRADIPSGDVATAYANTCVSWFTLPGTEVQATRLACKPAGDGSNPVEELQQSFGPWYLLIFGSMGADARKWIDHAISAMKQNWGRMPCNKNITPNGYLGVAALNSTKSSSLDSKKIWNIFQKSELLFMGRDRAQSDKAHADSLNEESDIDFLHFNLRCKPHRDASSEAKRKFALMEMAETRAIKTLQSTDSSAVGDAQRALNLPNVQNPLEKGPAVHKFETKQPDSKPTGPESSKGKRWGPG